MVVRMHQSHAILMMPAGMPRTAVAIYAPIFKANAKRTYSVQPTNNRNLMYCILLGIGKGKQVQVRNSSQLASEGLVGLRAIYDTDLRSQTVSQSISSVATGIDQMFGLR